MTAFLELRQAVAVAATPLEERLANIEASLTRLYSWLHQLPEYGKPKGARPIAIVGGGPSLVNSYTDLDYYDTIMVAGSAHDWVYDNVCTSPRYCVVSDPDYRAAGYLKIVDSLTTYLVASHCHESVFEVLEDYPVVLWHCLDDAYKPFLDEHHPNWTAVGGGCTVGLRAIAIAILLGYSNIHLFGFDSCLGPDGEHHAYPFAAGEELGEIMEVKIGDPGSPKTYRCEPYHIAQAKNFESFWQAHKKSFTPVFHGGGLMSDVYDAIKGFEGREL